MWFRLGIQILWVLKLSKTTRSVMKHFVSCISQDKIILPFFLSATAVIWLPLALYFKARMSIVLSICLSIRNRNLQSIVNRLPCKSTDAEKTRGHSGQVFWLVILWCSFAIFPISSPLPSWCHPQFCCRDRERAETRRSERGSVGGVWSSLQKLRAGQPSSALHQQPAAATSHHIAAAATSSAPAQHPARNNTFEMPRPKRSVNISG